MKLFVKVPVYMAAAMALAAVPAMGAAASTPSAAPAAGTSTSDHAGSAEQLQRTGFVDIRHLPVTPKHTNPVIARQFEPGLLAGPASPASPALRSLPVPAPANTPVVLNQARRGFEGIREIDSSAASGSVVEPPDQGLCVGKVGSTTVLAESVNLAVAFYTSTHVRLTPVVDLNTFFGVPQSDFTSDPKCYFDSDTGRWFHTVLGVHFTSSGAVASTYTAIAVSKTNNPLDGYYQYRVSALDLKNTNCPCFGDQPLLGADKYGFYVSTAEYTLSGAFVPGPQGFNGAQLYAMSKQALVNGTASRVVHYRNLTTQSGTMQPAISPSAQYATANGGTEYFVSGRDTLLPDGRLRPGQVNQVTAWALTGTSTLATATGIPRLRSTDVTTEVYGQPVPMTQRSGPYPLGKSLHQPLPRLDANDERVNQVVYAGGLLYTGVNTIVNPGPRTGIAWFVLAPRASAAGFTTGVHTQGYVAVAGANVAFPSIGVNTAGQGVIAMSLSGSKYYPSSAYQIMRPSGPTGAVQIAQLGSLPEDGFSCYPPYGDGVCRWGDYTTSVAAPDGTIWSGTEFIGAGPRDRQANWSTFIWPVKP